MNTQLALLLLLLLLLLPMMTAVLRTAGNFAGGDLTPIPHNKGLRAHAVLTGSNCPAIVLTTGRLIVGSHCRCMARGCRRMKRCASIMLHSSNTFEQV